MTPFGPWSARPPASCWSWILWWFWNISIASLIVQKEALSPTSIALIYEIRMYPSIWQSFIKLSTQYGSSRSGKRSGSMMYTIFNLSWSVFPHRCLFSKIIASRSYNSGKGGVSIGQGFPVSLQISRNLVSIPSSSWAPCGNASNKARN